jgi:hypothetical protein
MHAVSAAMEFRFTDGHRDATRDPGGVDRHEREAVVAPRDIFIQDLRIDSPNFKAREFR